MAPNDSPDDQEPLEPVTSVGEIANFFCALSARPVGRHINEHQELDALAKAFGLKVPPLLQNAIAVTKDNGSEDKAHSFRIV